MLPPDTMMLPCSFRRIVSALVVLSALGRGTVAFAQVGDADPAAKAQAEALFSEGVALLERGDAEAACPKLEAAVELTKGEALGGKLALARCYEKVGKLASAWGLYNEVAGRAQKAGQASRGDEARAGAEALEPKLHRVRLVVPAEVVSLPGLAIRLGDRPIAKGAWTTALPMDAGQSEIVVTADGKEAWRAVVTIATTPGTTTVQVPALRDTIIVERGAMEPTLAAPAGGSFWSSERIAGFILGLTGTAAVGAGLGIGAIANSNYDDGLVEGGCTGDPPVCDDTRFIDDARALGDASTGVFFGGLGTLIVGVIVFATAPNEAATASTPVKVQASVGPDLVQAGVSIRY
ncbi:MAG: hypothetical protein HOW73_16245 [Polyangiaceae bacterium]|nr:hypothetical protein [Polyangiaceae bacterium]